MTVLFERTNSGGAGCNASLADGQAFDFQLPPELEASAPPEARGLARDQVRLMVSYYGSDRVIHTRFRRTPQFLEAGDVVVVNTSGTMNAALEATRSDGSPLELHLSTRLPADLWSVEVRRPAENATEPFYEAQAGEVLQLPAGGTVTLHAPYDRHRPPAADQGVRLWVATLQLPLPLADYLNQYGFPIRYKYVDEQWPLAYYQTVYANEPGSAEMPSAGRAFTAELITGLVTQGVQVLPLVLHTGVASLEADEPPYQEFYRVPLVTARAVNAAHRTGQRVIAVGTTVVRALESVTDEAGIAHPGQGWTGLVIGPTRKLRAVDGLLTGLHEPRASHLAMLQALAGDRHLRLTYRQALAHRYLWHEFGDLHLILP